MNTGVNSNSGDLRLVCRIRRPATNRRLLRQVVHVLLDELLELPAYDLTIVLVGAREMARLNEFHLGHDGSTDVITLDYGGTSPTGELFVCVDEAVVQARRFGVPWTTELVRYCVHGVLHLNGYDDRTAAARGRMKAAENRLVRRLSRRFDLSDLAQKTKVPA